MVCWLTPVWDWPVGLVRDWARAKVWLRLWSGRLMAWPKGWELVALEGVVSAWLEVDVLELVPSAELELGVLELVSSLGLEVDVLEEVAELAAQSLSTSFAELSPNSLASNLTSESGSSLGAEL